MGKIFKCFMIAIAAIGLLVLPATAATIKNSQGIPFGTGNDTSKSYKIAYEVYSETAGVSTIADDTVSIGQLDITLTQPLSAGETVNVVIPASADFNSAGPGYKYGLCDIQANADTVCDPGEIIAVVPAAGVVTNNLGLSVTGAVIAGRVVRLVQFEDLDLNNQYTALETLLNGAGLYVRPGLNASCTDTKIIQVDFATPHETTASPYNMAYITPEFTFTSPGTSDLGAELDTNTDFKDFVLGSGVNVATTTQIAKASFFSITNNAPGAGPSLWIAYATISPTGNVSYKLNSVAVEAGVDTVTGGTTVCTTTDNMIWNCAETPAGGLVGPHAIQIDLDGIGENSPTNWTITDFAISSTTSGLRDLCITAPAPSIGAWYGGVEALVPFVKGDVANGYQTYIKLYNRYNKAAKIYVKPYYNDSTPIVIATDQIVGLEEIPANDMITITADDIGALPGMAGYDMAKAIPVKFLIRVPAQTGTTSLTGTIIPDGANFTGAASATSSATITHSNPFDPYIEGIVVSTYPGGQRSIPLEFKSFKQGEFNQ